MLDDDGLARFHKALHTAWLSAKWKGKRVIGERSPTKATRDDPAAKRPHNEQGKDEKDKDATPYTDTEVVELVKAFSRVSAKGEVKGAKFWEDVTTRVHDATGIQRKATAVQQKWKRLFKTYKDARARVDKSGASALRREEWMKLNSASAADDVAPSNGRIWRASVREGADRALVPARVREGWERDTGFAP